MTDQTATRPPAPTEFNPTHRLDFKESSNIRGARFDAASGMIDVEFASGDVYRFANFTQAELEEWKAAKSAGSWFDANMKKKPKEHPMVASSKKAASEAPGVMRGGDHIAQAGLASEIAGAVTDAAKAVASRTPAKATGHVNHDECQASVRERARTFYEAYIQNSDGKSWDGKPCPAWADLGNPVRSHWCAVVVEVDRQLTATGLTVEARQKHVLEIEHLKKLAAQAGGAADHRVDQLVLERTKLIDDEAGKLRARIAELEAALKSGDHRPWKGRGAKAEASKPAAAPIANEPATEPRDK